MDLFNTILYGNGIYVILMFIIPQIISLHYPLDIAIALFHVLLDIYFFVTISCVVLILPFMAMIWLLKLINGKVNKYLYIIIRVMLFALYLYFIFIPWLKLAYMHISVRYIL